MESDTLEFAAERAAAWRAAAAAATPRSLFARVLFCAVCERATDRRKDELPSLITYFS